MKPSLKTPAYSKYNHFERTQTRMTMEMVASGKNANEHFVKVQKVQPYWLLQTNKQTNKQYDHVFLFCFLYNGKVN